MMKKYQRYSGILELCAEVTWVLYCHSASLLSLACWESQHPSFITCDISYLICPCNAQSQCALSAPVNCRADSTDIEHGLGNQTSSGLSSVCAPYLTDPEASDFCSSKLIRPSISASEDCCYLRKENGCGLNILNSQ